ncbi:MAG: glycosyltransferase [Rhodothermales bacterium]
MRVIHTVSSLRADHGGPSRSVTALCSDLARQDVGVSIVTRQRQPGEPPPVMPASDSANVRFVEPEGGWHAFLPGAGRFGAAIRDTVGGGSGLIHDHGLWLPTNHASARAAARASVPFVVSTRGMLTEWALRFNAGKKRVAWALYQRRDLQSARLFHATAEEEVEDIRRAGLRQPVALIPNGVELPDRAREAPTGMVRKALFLSRVHPKKGLINLVRAWAEVRAEGWELVLAGPDEGGHRAEVEHVIRALGLEGIRWTGEVDDRAKWDLYYGADLFVLPTFSENFGIVVAEALAAGIPAITTRGAPWGILEERGCGWWIDTGVEPLVAALREATSLADERRLAMGQRGRAYVEEELSWAHVAAKMREAYVWVLEGGVRPKAVVVT